MKQESAGVLQSGAHILFKHFPNRTPHSMWSKSSHKQSITEGKAMILFCCYLLVKSVNPK